MSTTYWPLDENERERRPWLPETDPERIRENTIRQLGYLSADEIREEALEDFRQQALALEREARARQFKHQLAPPRATRKPKPPKPRRKPPPSRRALTILKWRKRADLGLPPHCEGCKRVTHPLMARGLCSTCYKKDRGYRPKHRDRNAYLRAWEEHNRERRNLYWRAYRNRPDRKRRRNAQRRAETRARQRMRRRVLLESIKARSEERKLRGWRA